MLVVVSRITVTITLTCLSGVKHTAKLSLLEDISPEKVNIIKVKVHEKSTTKETMKSYISFRYIINFCRVCFASRSKCDTVVRFSARLFVCSTTVTASITFTTTQSFQQISVFSSLEGHTMPPMSVCASVCVSLHSYAFLSSVKSFKSFKTCYILRI